MASSFEIIPKINNIRSKFDLIVLSQDWHPESHLSFACNHEGCEAFSSKIIEETAIHQVLWPAHAIQNTFGAEFHRDLRIEPTDIIVKKGLHRLYDSYSAFGCKHDKTQMKILLRSKNVRKVYVCGLALDYCVGNTALDACKAGFEVYVIMDCTKPVNQETGDKMIEEFQKRGVHMIESSDI